LVLKNRLAMYARVLTNLWFEIPVANLRFYGIICLNFIE